jgi:hypothetical protein
MTCASVHDDVSIVSLQGTNDPYTPSAMKMCGQHTSYIPNMKHYNTYLPKPSQPRPLIQPNDVS